MRSAMAPLWEFPELRRRRPLMDNLPKVNTASPLAVGRVRPFELRVSRLREEPV